MLRFYLRAVTMPDIVESLRWCRWRDRTNGDYIDKYDTSGIEAERLSAADEIERLRAALKGVEIALARDGSISGAMMIITALEQRSEDGK